MTKSYFKNMIPMTVMLLLYSLLVPSFIWALNPVNLATGPNVITLGGQSIDIPRKWGAIESVQMADPSRPLVVLIEDLHCHAEVQRHIADLLDYLRAQGLALVGLEGTSQAVPVDKLRTFPIKSIKAQVGRYLVRQGRLSGAELAASLSAQPLQLQGMENQDSYDRSYALAMSFLTNETLGYVWDVREQLNSLKAKVYHQPLLVFDKGREAFKAGRWPLRKYALYLLRQCGVHHINTTSLTGLKAYLRPLPDASLNQDDVQPDLAKAEQLIRERLYNSPDERRLDQQVHTLDAMEKLLSISMSPEEWACWEASGRSIEGICTYLRDQGALDVSLLEAVQVLKARCQAARDFYRLACHRSRLLALNMIRAMQSEHQHLAALVTGGFHTAQIQQELKAQAVNVVTIRPRLTRVDLVNPYWDILKGKRTPLERLLAQNQKALAVKPGLLLPELRDEMDVLLKALLVFEFKGLLKKSTIQFKARIQSVLKTYPANNQAIQFDPAQVKTLRARLLSLPFTAKAKSFFVTVGEKIKALKAREVMSIDQRHTVSYYDRKPEIAPEQARLLFMAVRWATYAMVSHQSVLTQQALTPMPGLFGLGFNLNLLLTLLLIDWVLAHYQRPIKQWAVAGFRDIREKINQSIASQPSPTLMRRQGSLSVGGVQQPINIPPWRGVPEKSGLPEVDVTTAIQARAAVIFMVEEYLAAFRGPYRLAAVKGLADFVHLLNKLDPSHKLFMTYALPLYQHLLTDQDQRTAEAALDNSAPFITTLMETDPTGGLAYDYAYPVYKTIAGRPDTFAFFTNNCGDVNYVLANTGTFPYDSKLVDLYEAFEQQPFDQAQWVELLSLFRARLKMIEQHKSAYEHRVKSKNRQIRYSISKILHEQNLSVQAGRELLIALDDKEVRDVSQAEKDIINRTLSPLLYQPRPRDDEWQEAVNDCSRQLADLNSGHGRPSDRADYAQRDLMSGAQWLLHNDDGEGFFTVWIPKLLKNLTGKSHATHAYAISIIPQVLNLADESWFEYSPQILTLIRNPHLSAKNKYMVFVRTIMEMRLLSRAEVRSGLAETTRTWIQTIAWLNRFKQHGIESHSRSRSAFLDMLDKLKAGLEQTHGLDADQIGYIYKNYFNTQDLPMTNNKPKNLIAHILWDIERRHFGGLIDDSWGLSMRGGRHPLSYDRIMALITFIHQLPEELIPLLFQAKSTDKQRRQRLKDLCEAGKRWPLIMKLGLEEEAKKRLASEAAQSTIRPLAPILTSMIDHHLLRVFNLDMKSPRMDQLSEREMRVIYFLLAVSGDPGNVLNQALQPYYAARLQGQSEAQAIKQFARHLKRIPSVAAILPPDRLVDDETGRLIAPDKMADTVHLKAGVEEKDHDPRKKVYIYRETSPIARLHLGWKLGESCLDIEKSNVWLAGYAAHPGIEILYIKEPGNDQPIARYSIYFEPEKNGLYLISKTYSSQPYNYVPLLGKYLVAWAGLLANKTGKPVTVFIPNKMELKENPGPLFQPVPEERIKLVAGPWDFYSDLDMEKDLPAGTIKEEAYSGLKAIIKPIKKSPVPLAVALSSVLLFLPMIVFGQGLPGMSAMPPSPQDIMVESLITALYFIPVMAVMLVLVMWLDRRVSAKAQAVPAAPLSENEKQEQQKLLNTIRVLAPKHPGLAINLERFIEGYASKKEIKFRPEQVKAIITQLVKEGIVHPRNHGLAILGPEAQPQDHARVMEKRSQGWAGAAILLWALLIWSFASPAEASAVQGWPLITVTLLIVVMISGFFYHNAQEKAWRNEHQGWQQVIIDGVSFWWGRLNLPGRRSVGTQTAPMSAGNDQQLPSVRLSDLKFDDAQKKRGLFFTVRPVDYNGRKCALVISRFYDKSEAIPAIARYDLEKKYGIKTGEDALRHLARKIEYMKKFIGRTYMGHPLAPELYAEVKDQEGSVVGYLMEWVEGKTLKEWVESGELSGADYENVIEQANEQMEIYHEQGLFHGDPNPGNIIANKQENNWNVRLVDFGINHPEKEYKTEEVNHRLRNIHIRNEIYSQIVARLLYICKDVYDHAGGHAKKALVEIVKRVVAINRQPPQQRMSEMEAFVLELVRQNRSQEEVEGWGIDQRLFEIDEFNRRYKNKIEPELAAVTDLITHHYFEAIEAPLKGTQSPREIIEQAIAQAEAILTTSPLDKVRGRRSAGTQAAPMSAGDDQQLPTKTKKEHRLSWMAKLPGISRFFYHNAQEKAWRNEHQGWQQVIIDGVSFWWGRLGALETVPRLSDAFKRIAASFENGSIIKSLIIKAGQVNWRKLLLWSSTVLIILLVVIMVLYHTGMGQAQLLKPGNMGGQSFWWGMIPVGLGWIQRQQDDSRPEQVEKRISEELTGADQAKIRAIWEWFLSHEPTDLFQLFNHTLPLLSGYFIDMELTLKVHRLFARPMNGQDKPEIEVLPETIPLAQDFKTMIKMAWVTQDQALIHYQMKSGDQGLAVLTLNQDHGAGQVEKVPLDGTVHQVDVSPDGKYAAILVQKPEQGLHGQVMIAEASDGQIDLFKGWRKLDTGDRKLYSLAWSPDSRQLALGGENQGFLVTKQQGHWTLKESGKFEQVSGPGFSVIQLMWLPKGDGILFENKRNPSLAGVLWRLPEGSRGQETLQPVGKDNAISLTESYDHYAISPDGRYLAVSITGDECEEVRIYPLENRDDPIVGHNLPVWPEPFFKIMHMDWTKQGLLLTTAGSEDWYDTHPTMIQLQFPYQPGALFNYYPLTQQLSRDQWTVVQTSPDGQYLAMARDHQLMLASTTWARIEKPLEHALEKGRTGKLMSMTWKADNKMLLLVSEKDDGRAFLQMVKTPWKRRGKSASAGLVDFWKNLKFSFSINNIVYVIENGGLAVDDLPDDWWHSEVARPVTRFELTGDEAVTALFGVAKNQFLENWRNYPFWQAAGQQQLLLVKIAHASSGTASTFVQVILSVLAREFPKVKVIIHGTPINLREVLTHNPPSTLCPAMELNDLRGEQLKALLQAKAEEWRLPPMHGARTSIDALVALAQLSGSRHVPLGKTFDTRSTAKSQTFHDHIVPIVDNQMLLRVLAYLARFPDDVPKIVELTRMMSATAADRDELFWQECRKQVSRFLPRPWPTRIYSKQSLQVEEIGSLRDDIETLRRMRELGISMVLVNRSKVFFDKLVIEAYEKTLGQPVLRIDGKRTPMSDIIESLDEAYSQNQVVVLSNLNQFDNNYQVFKFHLERLVEQRLSKPSSTPGFQVLITAKSDESYDNGLGLPVLPLGHMNQKVYAKWIRVSVRHLPKEVIDQIIKLVHEEDGEGFQFGDLLKALDAISNWPDGLASAVIEKADNPKQFIKAVHLFNRQPKVKEAMADREFRSAAMAAIPSGDRLANSITSLTSALKTVSKEQLTAYLKAWHARQDPLCLDNGKRGFRGMDAFKKKISSELPANKAAVAVNTYLMEFIPAALRNTSYTSNAFYTAVRHYTEMDADERLQFLGNLKKDDFLRLSDKVRLKAPLTAERLSVLMDYYGAALQAPAGPCTRLLAWFETWPVIYSPYVCYFLDHARTSTMEQRIDALDKTEFLLRPPHEDAVSTKVKLLYYLQSPYSINLVSRYYNEQDGDHKIVFLKQLEHMLRQLKDIKALNQEEDRFWPFLFDVYTPQFGFNGDPWLFDLCWYLYHSDDITAAALKPYHLENMGINQTGEQGLTQVISALSTAKNDIFEHGRIDQHRVGRDPLYATAAAHILRYNTSEFASNRSCSFVDHATAWQPPRTFVSSWFPDSKSTFNVSVRGQGEINRKVKLIFGYYQRIKTQIDQSNPNLEVQSWKARLSQQLSQMEKNLSRNRSSETSKIRTQRDALAQLAKSSADPATRAVPLIVACYHQLDKQALNNDDLHGLLIEGLIMLVNEKKPGIIAGLWESIDKNQMTDLESRVNSLVQVLYEDVLAAEPIASTKDKKPFYAFLARYTFYQTLQTYNQDHDALDTVVPMTVWLTNGPVAEYAADLSDACYTNINNIMQHRTMVGSLLLTTGQGSEKSFNGAAILLKNRYQGKTVWILTLINPLEETCKDLITDDILNGIIRHVEKAAKAYNDTHPDDKIGYLMIPDEDSPLKALSNREDVIDSSLNRFGKEESVSVEINENRFGNINITHKCRIIAKLQGNGNYKYVKKDDYGWAVFQTTPAAALLVLAALLSGKPLDGHEAGLMMAAGLGLFWLFKWLFRQPWVKNGLDQMADQLKNLNAARLTMPFKIKSSKRSSDEEHGKEQQWRKVVLSLLAFGLLSTIILILMHLHLGEGALSIFGAHPLGHDQSLGAALSLPLGIGMIKNKKPLDKREALYGTSLTEPAQPLLQLIRLPRAIYMALLWGLFWLMERVRPYPGKNAITPQARAQWQTMKQRYFPARRLDAASFNLHQLVSGKYHGRGVQAFLGEYRELDNQPGLAELNLQPAILQALQVPEAPTPWAVWQHRLAYALARQVLYYRSAQYHELTLSQQWRFTMSQWWGRVDRAAYAQKMETSRTGLGRLFNAPENRVLLRAAGKQQQVELLQAAVQWLESNPMDPHNLDVLIQVMNRLPASRRRYLGDWVRNQSPLGDRAVVPVYIPKIIDQEQRSMMRRLMRLLRSSGRFDQYQPRRRPRQRLQQMAQAA